ncbi:MAG: aldehyde dehydrogenase family protein [Sinimarinibacterium flocculans]|uniref:aldehyde dehydrogenase family protein n=1 Tax=Sinimarinibacterium flocculans TaxID=985250 RepID=UPI003C67E95F
MNQGALIINGQAVAGASRMGVIDPSTGEEFASCSKASASDLEAAVAAAKAAFASWSTTPFVERSRLLNEVADEIARRQPELATLLTREQGKVLTESTAEVEASVAFIRHLAGIELHREVIEDSATRRIEQHFRPLGVVAAIVPWNFPLLMACFKVAAALATGNTVVLKPSPSTPLCALALGAIGMRILPPGVLNVITDQNDLGPLLTAHPDVAKIAFTGSTGTGRKVMASAAASIKRITLELGGNDAAIVLDDADPAALAPALFGTAFFNSGQVCIAIKRIYAHEKIYEPLIAELARLANEAVVGPGLEPGTTHGPVQNRMQFDKVRRIIADARSAGQVAAGGEAADGGGYFIRPTIVRDARAGMPLVEDEQFGPVLPVIPFADVGDAVRQVNASRYGLGGSVWGTDTARAIEVASAIESGTVWVNKHLDFGPDIPFGGAKESGLGLQFSAAGLQEFTQKQILNIAKS